MSNLSHAQIVDYLDSLPPKEMLATLEVLHEWKTWARPEQLPPPGDWTTWLVCAGRGFGKTRTGAEWVRARVAAGARRIALIAPIASETRDVMVEGESGLLEIYPPSQRPHYEPSKRRISWPNGAQAFMYSADEPDRLRGPQHDSVWADELSSWRRPEAWDMAQFGLRLGNDPRSCVTTTPKPVKHLKRILEDEKTVVSRGSTFDNAENLPETFLHHILARHEGTRLGRQEIYAELLEDVAGAIVTRAMVDSARVTKADRPQRILIGIDPAVTSGEGSDETGIIVVAKDFYGDIAVLEDLSRRATPDGWARCAVEAFYRHNADRIIVERNNGGDLVTHTIRQVDNSVPVTAVVATRGKHVRFEPIGALYEQGRVHHVGSFPELEDQVTAFTPSGYEGGDSPDRADAMVWAATHLISGSWGFEEIYG